MDEYKELFEAGNKAQLEQMERNTCKNGWDDIDLQYGVDKLAEKAIDTKMQLDSISIRINEGDKYKKINKLEAVERLKEVRKKAAHSANFAHMIILACDKKLSTCGQAVDNA